MVDRKGIMSGPGCIRQSGAVHGKLRAPDRPVFTIIDRWAEMLPAIRHAKREAAGHMYREDCA